MRARTHARPEMRGYIFIFIMFLSADADAATHTVAVVVVLYEQHEHAAHYSTHKYTTRTHSTELSRDAASRDYARTQPPPVKSSRTANCTAHRSHTTQRVGVQIFRHTHMHRSRGGGVVVVVVAWPHSREQHILARTNISRPFQQNGLCKFIRL